MVQELQKDFKKVIETGGSGEEVDLDLEMMDEDVFKTLAN